MPKRKGKKKKKTTRTHDPDPSKLVILPRLEDSNRLSPIWSFELYDRGLDLPQGIADAISFVDIAEKLKNFERMTWGTIESNHYLCHKVPIIDFEKFARDRWIDLNRDDIDELYGFRLKNKERLWGWRISRIFQVVCWDPEHEVCPSQKKHT